MADAAATIRGALDRLAPGGPLGVAVSGGGDSMALLAVAHRWGGDRIHAVTVDHGLRTEAADEAAMVARFCAAHGIPHTILTLSDLPAGNVPAEARTARYAAIAEWAGAMPVALGHTLDDQAETLLMRLARGSGVDGLAAMADDRTWLGTRWLRPMLGVRRDALRALLQADGIGWAEDPTNEDLAYDRVRARAALAALAPLGIDAPGLAATAHRLAEARGALDAAMAALAARTRHWGTMGEAWLNPAVLAEAPAETLRRLLVDTLARVAARDYPPRQRALAPILADLAKGQAIRATLGGCLLCPDGDRLLICREPAAVQGALPLDGGAVVWDGRWTIEGDPGGDDWHVAALGRVADVPPDLPIVRSSPVWRTIPAIFRGAALAAVPTLDYADPKICGSGGRWTVTLTLRHDTPGDAACRDGTPP